MSGIKHDGGKLRMDLIPPEAMEGLAEVLTFGATKYGERNWERGIETCRIHAAALRHMVAWAKGERCDPKSSLSHLKHALCNLAFLVTFESREAHERIKRLQTTLLTVEERGFFSNAAGRGATCEPVGESRTGEVRS